jgi:hypothetical protein
MASHLAETEILDIQKQYAVVYIMTFSDKQANGGLNRNEKSLNLL